MKAANAFHGFQQSHFPRKVNGYTFELLNNGLIYMAGRDRFYRPVIVLNGWKINTFEPKPTEEDLITMALFYM